MAKSGVDTERRQEETWERWQASAAPPAGELWTREEILDAIERLGIRRPNGRLVTERTIRFWQSKGVIPYGKKEKRGYIYRLYPGWFVDMLYQVCCYEAAGIRIEELPERMRVEAFALSLLVWGRQKAGARRKKEPQAGEGLGGYIARMVGNTLHEPTQPPFGSASHAVTPGSGNQFRSVLNAFVSALGQASIPLSTHQVRIQFLDAAGEVLTTHEMLVRDYPHHSGDKRDDGTTDTKVQNSLSVIDKIPDTG